MAVGSKGVEIVEESDLDTCECFGYWICRVSVL